MVTRAAPGGRRTRRRRSQEERREATRGAVLDATVECLAERGYAGTTTTRIARRAQRALRPRPGVHVRVSPGPRPRSHRHRGRPARERADRRAEGSGRRRARSQPASPGRVERGGIMSLQVAAVEPHVFVPEEERPAARKETFRQLVSRLSHQSVVKHFDAYADIAWDAEEFRIDPLDPRWELAADDVLGGSAWYRAQPLAVRARLGLHLVAHFMKIGLQFEGVLKRGLLAFAASLPNRSPEL